MHAESKILQEKFYYSYENIQGNKMEIKRVLIYSVVFILISITGYRFSGHYIDRSQTVLDASKAGAPTVDKIWTLDEYDQFFRYLSSLPDDVDYPMLSSDRSGQLFKTFLNSLDKTLQASSENDMMFLKIVKLKNICHEVLKLYVDKDIKTQKYTDEIAHLYGIQIKIYLDMQMMANAIKKENSSEGLTKKGLDLIKDGTAVQISITMDLLTEYQPFKDNTILMGYVKQYVPQLLESFDERRKKALKQRIVEASRNTNAPSVKKLLNDIASPL